MWGDICPEGSAHSSPALVSEVVLLCPTAHHHPLSCRRERALVPSILHLLVESNGLNCWERWDYSKNSDFGLKQKRWRRHRFLPTNSATGWGESNSGMTVPSTAAPWLWAWVGIVHSQVLPDPAVHRKLFGTTVGAGLWALLSGILTVIISVIQKSACKLTFPQQECVCLVRSVCLYCQLRDFRLVT